MTRITAVAQRITAVAQSAQFWGKLAPISLNVKFELGCQVENTVSDDVRPVMNNVLWSHGTVSKQYFRCGRILGRAAKRHLEAEGLLVTNREWNQVSAPNACISA